ncbi:alpha/beta hydrolase [Chryseobacterium sp. T1]
MKLFYFLCLGGLVLSCTSNKNYKVVPVVQYQEFEKTYLDTSRNRDIPVCYYVPKNYKKEKLPLIIFSHGYGRNQPGSNKEYSALLSELASNGYFVVSIQHELFKDELLPLEGKAQLVRRPNWDRGVQNILYVYNRVKKDFPELNYNQVTIAGHSNGGDMSTLFVEQYPKLVSKLITLDQRRYALPYFKHPKIYSLRSSDQLPDEGVLPPQDEQDKLGMTIIKLKKTIHNDMDDSGSESQKKEIENYFLDFLKS